MNAVIAFDLTSTVTSVSALKSPYQKSSFLHVELHGARLGVLVVAMLDK